MALPLFAVTLFVSAFLLFLVQPMIGKMILPKLGGTPQVWNTCMVFFQMTLLAGYAYTHNLSTRLATRLQLVVHGLLLVVPVIVLLVTKTFDVSDWFPDPSGIPVLQALSELALLVGVPFFVVSTSAPLLQKWFINTGHPAASDPYFLYGASNLGSLLSLLFYPFLFEPWFTLREQSLIWFGGYIGLFCLIAACIAMVWKSPLSLQPSPAGPELSPEMPAVPPLDAPPVPPVQPQTSTAVKSGPAPGAAHQRGITRKKGLKAQVRTPAAVGADEARSYRPIVSRPSDAPVTAFRRLRWILLAAVPSSLMLGVTSYISTDLSPFPLIWIVPLALYLLSFILVYMRWPITWTSSDSSTTTPHALVMYIIQPLGILGMCFVLLVTGFHWGYMVLAWAAFFATALACHGELAKDRPHPRYLTEYFLLMSVGGALGGFFNAIVAPLIFPGVWEFYIALVLSCFVRPVLLQTNWTDNFLMSSFPGVQTWAREQSDQLSRSFGRTATGSTYVLSFMLDVVLGLSMIAVAYALNTQRVWVDSFIRFTGAGALGANTWPLIIYGPPLVMCGLFSSRPVRFGVAITMLLLMHMYFLPGRDDTTLYQGRTYFGVLRVLRAKDTLYHENTKGEVVPKDLEETENFSKPPKDKVDGKPQYAYNYTYLMHGTTYHGRNYIYRPGEDNVDLSRLATTYYYRYGPVGVVLEKFNWFPGPQNSFWGDLRMPASMVGDVAAMIGTGTLPNAALVNAYSEPPLATIGLGTGTMASYARPYGHFTYYEIDEQIRNFSLPPRGEPAYFTYLLNAMRRGVNLEIIMGDARLSIEKPQLTLFPVLPYDTRFGVGDPEQASNNHADLETLKNKLPKDREHYYKAINVDAFSSDAIPVHLVTLEAIQLYMKKISHDGVLCVHTSNRHLDLLRPVAKIVEVLDEQFQREFKEKTPLEEFGGGPRPENMKRLKAMVGKDNPMLPANARDRERSKFLGHFSSEYIMVYYDEKYLKPLKNYVDTLPDGKNYNIYQDRSTVVWHAPKHLSPAPWTDDYSNLVRIMRGLPVFGINNEFD